MSFAVFQLLLHYAFMTFVVIVGAVIAFRIVKAIETWAVARSKS